MNDAQKECARLVDAFLTAVNRARSADAYPLEQRLLQGSTGQEIIHLWGLRKEADEIKNAGAPVSLDMPVYALNRLAMAETFASIANRILAPEEKEAIIPAGANRTAIIETLQKARAVQLAQLFATGPKA